MVRVSNERAAWLAEHVLPHEPALRGWLCRRRVLRLEVDDIIQEAYAVLASLDSVEHITDPKSYFYAVAHSLIVRHLRRSRIVSIETMAEIDGLGLLAHEISPEKQVGDIQELARLMRAISALPEKCREAFMLRKVQGLSQREIAQHMGVSENTVEKHIGKALRALLEALGRIASPEVVYEP